MPREFHLPVESDLGLRIIFSSGSHPVLQAVVFPKLCGKVMDEKGNVALPLFSSSAELHQCNKEIRDELVVVDLQTVTSKYLGA